MDLKPDPIRFVGVYWDGGWILECYQGIGEPKTERLPLTWAVRGEFEVMPSTEDPRKAAARRVRVRREQIRRMR